MHGVTWFGSPRAWGEVLAAVALLAVGAVSLQQCGGAELGGGSSVAYNGRHYAVAWVADGADVYVAQFPQLSAARARTADTWAATSRAAQTVSGAAMASPERIYRGRVAARPEIVWTSAGYLVVVNRGRDGLAVFPLSADGRLSGDPIEVVDGPVVLCATPTWTGRDLVVGFSLDDPDSGRLFGIVRVGAGRATTVRRVLSVGAGSPTSCAIDATATTASLTAVAHDDSDGAHLFLAHLGEDDEIVVTDVDAADEIDVRNLSEGRGEYAISYRRDGVAYAAWVRGDEVELRAFDKADARTFDLVQTGAGHAAAWYDRGAGEVVVSLGDESRAETDRATLERPSLISPLRLGTFGTQCAATWTELGGRYVLAFRLRPCGPRPGETDPE